MSDEVNVPQSRQKVKPNTENRERLCKLFWEITKIRLTSHKKLCKQMGERVQIFLRLLEFTGL